ncbi:MAG: hypothetical protein AAF940_08285 [Pseudomonadota bacterium]
MSDAAVDSETRGWQPKKKRTGRFRNFAILFGLLGLVAASEIGHLVFVLGLVTVIGIPLAFLVMALPTIGLVVCGAFLVWRLRPHRGEASVLTAFAVVIATLVVVPTLHNLEINARLAQLASGDKGSAEGPSALPLQRGGVVGLIKRRSLCEAACVHLLMTGQASQVFVTRFRKNRWAPDFSADAHRYQLEKHAECPERRVHGGGVSLHGQHTRDKTPGTIAGAYARLQDEGYCMVITKASLRDADVVVTARTFRYFDSPWTVSPIPSLMRAGRMAVYQRDADNRFVTHWQQTPVDYSLLMTPLAVIFRTQAEFRTTTEFWRTHVRDERRQYHRNEVLRQIGFRFPDQLV